MYLSEVRPEFSKIQLLCKVKGLKQLLSVYDGHKSHLMLSDMLYSS